MKKYTTIIGIDPGATGSVSIKKGKHYELHYMPNDFIGLMDLLKVQENAIAFVERVSHWRTDDPIKKMRLAKMQESFDACVNACQAARMDYCLILPTQWRSVLRMPQVDEYTDRKRENAKFAKGYAPEGIKITQKNADGFLIMFAGVLQIKHNPSWVDENTKMQR